MKSFYSFIFIFVLIPFHLHSQSSDLFLANGESLSATSSIYIFSDTSIIDNLNITNLHIFADVNYSYYFKDYHAFIIKPSFFLPISFPDYSYNNFRAISFLIGYDYYLVNNIKDNSAYSFGVGLGPALYINTMIDVDYNKLFNIDIKLDSYLKASYYYIIKDSYYCINISAQLFIGNIVNNKQVLSNLNISTMLSLGYTYYISNNNKINI